MVVLEGLRGAGKLPRTGIIVKAALGRMDKKSALRLQGALVNDLGIRWGLLGGNHWGFADGISGGQFLEHRHRTERRSLNGLWAAARCGEESDGGKGQ